MMNHRGVTNGTPLARRFTNWARELRDQSGGTIKPVLIGYTDAPTDPVRSPKHDEFILKIDGFCAKNDA